MPELLRGHGSLRLTYLRGVSRSDAHRIQRALSPAKVLLPLGLGVAVAWWLLDSSWDDPVRDPASGLETTTTCPSGAIAAATAPLSSRYDASTATHSLRRSNSSDALGQGPSTPSASAR